MRISNQKYYAGAYKRLSREGEIAALGARNESNSISNQRDLIQKFVKSHPEIEIVKEYADDGFSGVDFERPSFTQMIEDIKACGSLQSVKTMTALLQTAGMSSW